MLLHVVLIMFYVLVLSTDQPTDRASHSRLHATQNFLKLRASIVNDMFFRDQVYPSTPEHIPPKCLRLQNIEARHQRELQDIFDDVTQPHE